MAYCESSDLTALVGTLRLAELTNDTSGATTVDSTVVTALITRADTIIDAKMSGVYTTPFTSVPKIIKQCSISIALYNAFLRRFANMEVPKEWIEANKQAMQMLEDIANLKVTLDTAPTVISAESEFTAPTRLIDFEDSDYVTSYY